MSLWSQADHNNRIVRYYESSDTAPYFGSQRARDNNSGRYDRSLEGRAIASTGKMISAMAIANEGRDTLKSGYLDRNAPSRGLETCRRSGSLRRTRSAQVAFACSLNGPLEWRTARVGQRNVSRLIRAFGFNMPPADGPETETPPSTAAVRGLIAGSPRRVHHMSAVILAALAGRGQQAQSAPSLVRDFDFSSDTGASILAQNQPAAIRPYDVIAPRSAGMLRRLLEAPLCYRANRRSHGTLKDLSNWCAQRRADMAFHFAKTGTQVNEDPDETVDVWATGGLQFTNGAAYSYVVLVGTGTPNRPFARSLHSSQVAAPLLATLLRDLANHARRNPVTYAQARRRPRAETQNKRRKAASAKPRKSLEVSDIFNPFGD